MRRLAIMAGMGTALFAAGDDRENWLRNGAFTEWDGPAPAAWKPRSQRPEIRPGLSRRTEDGCTWARLEALPDGRSMGWLEQKIAVPKMPVEDPGWLRFSCRVRLDGDQNAIENVRIALQWDKEADDGKGWRPNRWFFVPVPADAGATAVATTAFPILPSSRGITVMLLQYGGRAGGVAFTDVRLTPIPAPRPRRVRIATTYYFPRGGKGWADTLAGVEKLTAEAAAEGCDLILFGEGLSVLGTGRGYADPGVAEPIPGPHSETLGSIAAKHGIFLAAGLYEREGESCYNTAVLFDRKGRLAGKYRKVHLPFPELYGGLRPGTGFPVFETELGRIGLQICYDHHFVESARCLALNGAEIILTPIWGDMRSDGEVYECVARERAVDNGVFYVTSIYSLRRGLIVDPFGRILAETSGRDEPNLAIAELNLNACKAVRLPYRVPPNFQINHREERRPSAYGSIIRPRPPR